MLQLTLTYLCDNIYLVDCGMCNNFYDYEETVKRMMYEIDPIIDYEFIRYNPKQFYNYVPEEYSKAYYFARHTYGKNEDVYFLNILGHDMELFPMILKSYINSGGNIIYND